MQVIIYGKENCADCERSKMLCQIQSIDFQYQAVGHDISAEELQSRVGQPVRSLPQIFIDRDGERTWVGGYQNLRSALRAPH